MEVYANLLYTPIIDVEKQLTAMECVGAATVGNNVIHTAVRNFYVLVGGWANDSSVTNYIMFYNKSGQEIIADNNSSGSAISKISTYFIPTGQKFKVYRQNAFEAKCYDYKK
jgi:hypothetical protein